jgi:drug/metabolite transporter (DMT)-like permease
VTATVLALLAALAYGVSDFAGGMASRKATAVRVLVLSYPLGLVGLFALMPIFGGTATTAGLAWGAVSGLAGAGGVMLLYAGLAAGPMSVVAPLTAVCSAVVPVGAGLLAGERPAPLAGLGALLALVAVALVSREPAGVDAEVRVTGRAILLALLAGVFFGLYFVMLAAAGDDTGLWPLVTNRVVGSVVVVVAALVLGQLALPGRGAWLLATSAGLLDVVANVAYLLAARAGLLALVAVLTALYPAATVLLARVVLAERTSLVQRLGLVLAGASIALIAYAGAG